MTNMAPASSPRTPTARKAPSQPSSSSSKTQNTPKHRKASNTPASQKMGNTIKIKTEEIPPMNIIAPVKRQRSGSSTSTIPMVPPQKKQKGEQDARSETTTTAHTQTPTHTRSPNRTLPTAPTAASIISRNLLAAVLHVTPTLLPASGPSPSLPPILSRTIDTLAHSMWQLAITHGRMLQVACQYGAMFAPLKLAALAKLNYLPSWWLFREMAVKELVGGGWRVDDGDMEGVWREAIAWCGGYRKEKWGEGSGGGGTGDRNEGE